LRRKQRLAREHPERLIVVYLLPWVGWVERNIGDYRSSGNASFNAVLTVGGNRTDYAPPPHQRLLRLVDHR